MFWISIAEKLTLKMVWQHTSTAHRATKHKRQRQQTTTAICCSAAIAVERWKNENVLKTRIAGLGIREIIINKYSWCTSDAVRFASHLVLPFLLSAHGNGNSFFCRRRAAPCICIRYAFSSFASLDGKCTGELWISIATLCQMNGEWQSEFEFWKLCHIESQWKCVCRYFRHHFSICMCVPVPSPCPCTTESTN